jgi:Fuc2NAc and GlcNAc transferase
MTITLAAYIAVFILTLAGVGLFRGWSRRRELLDLPNERSSHTTPTPRGGGIVVCCVCLSSLSSLLIYQAAGGVRLGWWYFAGALIVAVISWIDDLRSIPAFWRFLCHGLAAALVVSATGGFATISVPFYGLVDPGATGKILAFFWIVWLVNAYNFMDGIDGIAATQAVTAGAGWFLFGIWQGFGEIAFAGGLLAVSAAAFLVHNWQPARVFMGDVGSAFFGYSFAVMPFLPGGRDPGENAPAGLLPPIALLFVWFFVFDSVLTFLRRLAKGEKVWRAHRQHMYQELVIGGLSHRSVTALYGAGSAAVVGIVLYALSDARNFEKIVTGGVALVTVPLFVLWRKKKLAA